MINEWVKQALSDRGIETLPGGKFKIKFFRDVYQTVPDLPTAIRQQQHIIDQQISEQAENTEIGKLMKSFHELVVVLSKMTVQNMTEGRYHKLLIELEEVLQLMSKKREELRKDGYNRLCKVFKMLEKKNIPAANTASLAALERMRKRWLVNQKVIDRSQARLTCLKELSIS